jgi:hypothetical protein
LDIPWTIGRAEGEKSRHLWRDEASSGRGRFATKELCDYKWQILYLLGELPSWTMKAWCRSFLKSFWQFATCNQDWTTCNRFYERFASWALVVAVLRYYQDQKSYIVCNSFD